jgi:NAD(P)-dependent dehydrogenase (short-subunit alcohol dehydrogenase family)
VAAKVLSEAGFDVTTATVDVSSRASVRALVEMATLLGEVQGVIHAAGVTRMKTATVRRLASPSHAVLRL